MFKCDVGHTFWELISKEMVAVHPRTLCTFGNSSPAGSAASQAFPTRHPNPPAGVNKREGVSKAHGP